MHNIIIICAQTIKNVRFGRVVSVDRQTVEGIRAVDNGVIVEDGDEGWLADSRIQINPYAI